ncbi:MAG TPA: hypothetical protein VFY04_03115 [Solirubrobacterales bacterium]|nr:hypothetical protein [Solirubrobacterales bacterium]
MRARPLIAIAATIALLAVLASAASAHTLKAARAANANNLVAREVCRGFVDDPDLGTCVDWTSGPCRRVSEHRIRCQMVHFFEHENGARLRCQQVQEWLVSEGKGELKVRPVPRSAFCRQTHPPEEPAAP